jgi:hypothetical protein
MNRTTTRSLAALGLSAGLALGVIVIPAVADSAVEATDTVADDPALIATTAEEPTSADEAPPLRLRDREQRHAQLAARLAEQLGVDEGEVAAVLDDLRAERLEARDQRRAEAQERGEARREARGEARGGERGDARGGERGEHHRARKHERGEARDGDGAGAPRGRDGRGDGAPEARGRGGGPRDGSCLDDATTGAADDA